MLIGSGLGHCLNALVERGLPVVVIDREAPILALTKADEIAEGSAHVLWIDDPDPRSAFNSIAEWAQTHGHRPLHR